MNDKKKRFYHHHQKAKNHPHEKTEVTEKAEKDEMPPKAEPPEVPVEQTEVVSVAFRSSGKAYYFSPEKYDPKVGDAVIVETSRGQEYGTVKAAKHKVPSTSIVSPLRPLIRIATEDDKERFLANCEQEKYAMKICREKIAEHKLDMSLVNAEYTFDNRKLLFYFTSDTRVDFRELVKDLASVFHVRIELRQIGIRDEAKMLGGLGVCGRPFCCAGFLSDFIQVSIKMAKEQNFSLNSSKISGSCGRLMCCLRYEHETYEEALKALPPVGSTVSTPAGEATVVELRPLLESVKVAFEDKSEGQKTFPVSEIKVIRSGKAVHSDEKKHDAKSEKPQKSDA